MKLPFLYPKNSSPTDQELEEFRELCIRASRAMETAGISKAPFNSPELHRFREHEDRARVTSVLRTYVEVLEGALDQGEDLRDDKRLIWRMIQKMGFTPVSDFMGVIEDGDTIEIYTVDNWQIFRNMRCLECLSMSVEEILTFVWHRDSSRDMKLTWRLLELMMKVKTGLFSKTMDLSDIPKHTVKERVGKQWTISIQLRYGTPLRQNGRLVAFLVTNKSEIISRG